MEKRKEIYQETKSDAEAHLVVAAEIGNTWNTESIRGVIDGFAAVGGGGQRLRIVLELNCISSIFVCSNPSTPCLYNKMTFEHR